MMIKNSILLGQTIDNKKEMIEYSGDQDLLTIGVNNSANHHNTILKNLLNYTDSVVIVDIDGHFYKQSNKRRTELGNKIIKLDPYHLIDDHSDQLNPLDAIPIKGVDVRESIVEFLQDFSFDSDNKRFIQIHNLFLGVLQYFFSSTDTDTKSNLTEVIDLLYKDDAKYQLAVLLDKADSSQEGIDLIANILGEKNFGFETTLTELRDYIRDLHKTDFSSFLHSTSFDINSLFIEEPSSVYLILPMDKIVSHQLIIRLWLGAFITMATNIKTQIDQPVLFLLEQVEAMGEFDKLSFVLKRRLSSNVKFWTFWNSIEQAKLIYKTDWASIMHNVGVLQFIGLNNPSFLSTITANTIWSIKELHQLQQNEQLLIIDQKHTFRAITFESESQEAELKTSLILAAKSKEGKQEGFTIAAGLGNLCTIARPTSQVKEELITQNLIHYDKPIIIVDSNGEYFSKTKKELAGSGKKIIKLDPFGICDEDKTDTFNPFDVLQFIESHKESRLQEIIQSLVTFPTHLDPFWDIEERNFLFGVLSYLDYVPEKKCSLEELEKSLGETDLIYNLATVLDILGKEITPLVYRTIANFLQEGDNTRKGIKVGSMQFLKLLNEKRVRESINSTSFELDTLFSNEPSIVFIIFPLSKVPATHKLLRVWLSAFIIFINNAKHRIQSPVLFLLEGQYLLGEYNFLRRTVSYSNIPTMKFWTFWSDPDRVEQYFKKDWTSISKTMEVLQFLDVTSPLFIKEIAKLTNWPIAKLDGISKGEQVLSINQEPALQMDNLINEARHSSLKCGNRFTIASQAGSKRANIIIPNLMDSSQTTIVLDIDGVYCSTTMQKQLDKGQKIVVMDPFKICGEQTDTFNPFDIIPYSNDDAYSTIDYLIQGLLTEKDFEYPFWRHLSQNFIFCCMVYLFKRNKLTPFELQGITTPETNMKDTLAPEVGAEHIDSYYKKRILEFIEGEDCLGKKRKTKIVDDAQCLLQDLGTPITFDALSSTSFNLEELLSGQISTVYLVFPNTKIASHQSILRLWLGGLVALFATAKKQTTKPALFLLEHLNNLGKMNYLKDMLKLPYIPEADFWTFWEDTDEIKQYFGNDWKSILNNADWIQFFETQNHNIALQASDLVNLTVEELKAIPAEEYLSISNRDGTLKRLKKSSS